MISIACDRGGRLHDGAGDVASSRGRGEGDDFGISSGPPASTDGGRGTHLSVRSLFGVA